MNLFNPSNIIPRDQATHLILQRFEEQKRPTDEIFSLHPTLKAWLEHFDAIQPKVEENLSKALELVSRTLKLFKAPTSFQKFQHRMAD
jgi:hypothetical protein